MNRKRIRFAVIGYGHIGKRHVDMILGNPYCELVGVCDCRSMEETGFDIGGIPYYSDFSDVLREPGKIDVINICVPNGLHAKYTLEALEAKCHVVIEKPMALTRQDAERMVFKSLEVSREVFCVMQNRYSPPSQWLKEVLNQELLGEIFMVQVNCFWNRDQRYYHSQTWHGDKEMDGGTLFTQFSHFVDIMYWLFGDIKNIRGHFADFNHQELTDFEDSGVVSFDFVKGGVGSFSYSTSVRQQNLESSMTIIGERGTIKVSGQYMNEVVHCQIEGYEMPKLPPCLPPNDYGPYKGSAANHHFVIENVVNKLFFGQTITTNAMEGLKVVDIIERIYKVRDRYWKKNREEEALVNKN